MDVAFTLLIAAPPCPPLRPSLLFPFFFCPSSSRLARCINTGLAGGDEGSGWRRRLRGKETSEQCRREDKNGEEKQTKETAWGNNTVEKAMSEWKEANEKGEENAERKEDKLENKWQRETRGKWGS